MKEKECTKCLEVKLVEEFTRPKNSKVAKHGYSAWCRNCQSEAANRWGKINLEKKRLIHAKWRKGKGVEYYIKNKEKQVASVRKSTLKRLYGITPEQYDTMFKAQAGACAICQKQNLNGERLCIDHDHKTGKVRELLCKSCNVGIAQFNEDEEILAKAIAYVSKHRLAGAVKLNWRW